MSPAVATIFKVRKLQTAAVSSGSVAGTKQLSSGAFKSLTSFFKSLMTSSNSRVAFLEFLPGQQTSLSAPTYLRPLICLYLNFYIKQPTPRG